MENLIYHFRHDLRNLFLETLEDFFEENLDQIAAKLQKKDGQILHDVASLKSILSCSKVSIYRYINSGELPHLRIGGSRGAIRVLHSDLLEFLEKKKTS